MKLVVVGSGKAAKALAPRWSAAGHEVIVRSRRDGPIAEAPAGDVVVLAVPDGVIADVAKALRGRPSAADEVWLHLSGVSPAAVLRAATAAGTPRAAGCLHPLVALAPGGDPSGAVAGIEGDAEATTVATQLAKDAGLVPHPIPADRALYHAAAVTVAGHATALFAQAMTLLETLGFSPAQARAALQPLMRSAVSNLADGPPETVITGPLARGDAATIRTHLAALEVADADTRAVYRALGRRALALSRPQLEPQVATELAQLLSQHAEEII